MSAVSSPVVLAPHQLLVHFWACIIDAVCNVKKTPYQAHMTFQSPKIVRMEEKRQNWYCHRKYGNEKFLSLAEITDWQF